MRWLRTYVLTPPLSAACFLLFWASSWVAHPFDRSGRIHHRIARFWSWLLLRSAGVRILTSGLDRLSAKDHYLYISNHMSFADTPVMAACLPTEFRFMARSGLMKWPIIGGHLKRGGHIPVHREDARGALKSMAEAVRILREAGRSVLIFPEGTRGSGELQSFKGGAAHLAIQAGVPVVPLALTGTADVLPRKAFLLRPGIVHVHAGEPMPTAHLTARDRAAFTQELERRVAQLLARPVAGESAV